MNILLAFDGSVEAQAAGAWLGELAFGENSLEVLTVVHHRLPHKDSVNGESPLLVGPVEKALWKSTKTMADRLAPRFGEIGTCLRAGDVIEEILDEARCSGAELIVLGHRHRPLLAEKLPGSVTRGVLERAPCSVMLVPCGSTAPRRVLLAYDGSLPARAALQSLVRLPLGNRLHVEVITTAEPVPPPVTMADPNGMTYMTPAVIEAIEAEMDQRGDAAAKLAADAARQLDRTSWEVSGITPSGDPACEILEAAKTSGADLIVLGGHQSGGPMEGPPSNTAAAVIHQASCAVLVGRVNNSAPRHPDLR